MNHLRVSLWNMRYVLLVAAFALAAKALFLLLTSIEGLALTTWIIDDAFIEMAVAFNIAIGHGFSYDFVHATTGSPFLWTYLISINFLIFSKILAIKMSFVLSSFCATLATLVVFATAEHITKSRTAAWIAFLLATFTGNAFFEAMNGMDTALFTLFLITTVATFLGVGINDRWPAFVRGAIPGMFAGLSIMVRGDGIFIAATLVLVQLWKTWKSKKKEDVSILSGIILLAAVGFAILTVWQMLRTGSPFPANQVGRRDIALNLHHFAFDHFALVPYIKIVVWNMFQLENLITIAAGSAALCIIALFFGLSRYESRTFATLTFVYTGIFFGMLIAYQWYFPDFHGLRYINPAVHLFCVLIAWMFVSIPWGNMKTIGLTLSVSALIISSQYAFYNLTNHMPWDKNMSFIGQPTEAQIIEGLEPIYWMRDHLPADTIIGVRDHGRIALFTGLPVQDIAGNIDPNVPALVKKDPTGQLLKNYLKERNVSYLVLSPLENRPELLYKELYGAFGTSLKKVTEIERKSGNLYKIDWETAAK